MGEGLRVRAIVGEAKQSHWRLVALDEIATLSFRAGGLLAMTETVIFLI